MSKLDPGIKRRYDAATNIRMMNRDFLDDAFRFIRPNSNIFDSNNGPQTETPGKQKNIVVYDLTAPLAARQFVSKMHSTLTPPFVQWAKLTAGSLVQSTEGDKLEEKLQQSTDVLFKYIQDSAFELTVNEAYADLIMGTAAIKIDEGDDDNPLAFSSVPLAALSIEESPDGVIRTQWMDFRLTVKDILELWPQATIPSNVASQKNQETKLEVVNGTIWMPDKKEYYYYVAIGSEVVWEETFVSSPWIVFRWMRLSGDTWGRGIAHDALPTIKTLNKAVEMLLTATAISIAPPMLGFSDDVMNISNLRIEPNTIIPISRSSMANPPLIPLDLRPNVQLADLTIQGMQDVINKAFLADPIGGMNDPTKTATEIDYRERLLLEEIGPAFGRLQVEFFAPVIDRCVYILKKKGLMAPIEIDGKEVAIKFSSPLAKTQDQDDLQSLGTAQQFLAQIYGPEISASFLNLTETVEYVAKKTGSELSVYRDSDALDQIQDALLQKAAEAMQPVQPDQQGQDAAAVPQQLPAAQQALQGQQ